MKSKKNDFFCCPTMLLIILGFTHCCSKNPAITHLDFLDSRPDDTYTLLDTNHTNPVTNKVLYYIIDTRRIDCIEDSVIRKYVKSDSLIAEEANKYGQVELVFFKKSSNTELLVSRRSPHNLPYCEDDVVMTYTFNSGKLTSTLKYRDGVILDP